MPGALLAAGVGIFIFWKVIKPLQIMDNLVKILFTEVFVVRLHQLSITFSMAN